MSLTETEDNGNCNVAPRFSTLDAWLEWQESLHFTGIDLGLERCSKVADRMGLLRPVFFVVSIAGTNGKGSSAVMLENILQAAGYKTGLYTSPHLVRYNERIRVNGQYVDDGTLCDSFSRIDRARGDISLTYFEFGTLAAMDIFSSSGIEIAVMEVGLGGRLDAVNMLDADVAMVSTIDIDHEQWLGNNRDAIGREKAGIFRAGRPAVCADPVPPDGLLQAADVTGAILLRSNHAYSWEISGDSWSWLSADTHYHRLPVPGGQVGQVQNAAGVLMVLQTMAGDFPVAQEAICDSLRNFFIPGRCQLVPGEIPLLLDVAHNCQSARALAENLDDSAGGGSTLLVLGMLRDKNHNLFVRELAACVDSWYLAELDVPRGADNTLLADAVKLLRPAANMQAFNNPVDAFNAARAEAKPGDRIVVTGSFVTVGAIMKYLGIPG